MNALISFGVDLGDIGDEPFGGEEAIKVAHAVGHGVYGLSALAFGLGAEAVAFNKT